MSKTKSTPSKGAAKAPVKSAAKKAPAKPTKPVPKKVVKPSPKKAAKPAAKAPTAKKGVSKPKPKAPPAKKPTAKPVKAPASKSPPAKKKAAAAPVVAAKKAAPAPVKAVPAKAAAPVKAAPVSKKVVLAVVPPAQPKPAIPTTKPVPTPPPPAPPKPASGSKSAKTAIPTRTVLAATASEPIAPPKPPSVSTEKPTATKTGALYYDSHMHTPLCKHAWGEPEEYCAQGVKSGLKGIIFTCHCPMPDGFWPTVRMSESEFDVYLGLVQRAKDAYKNKLDVCLGIESEFFPGYEKYIETLHQRADFDYCLGGLHWQAKEYLNKFETGTIEGFRRIYFDHLAVSAETGLYDCLAHPDLVKNYHPDSWCFAIIKNTVSTVLDRIAKTGVAMELNTSGLNKSYSEMNPGNEMLRMMAERKIPIVLGSDAHRAPRVGEHFITALNNLAEAGFENVSYFKKRQSFDLKIGAVISSIRRAADANA